MSVVDTPGTNVILERQQRLTEEFVPRADLVLFVLSADRALTESEVRRGSRFCCQQQRVFSTSSVRPLEEGTESCNKGALLGANVLLRVERRQHVLR
jgi:hypothetical protein